MPSIEELQAQLRAARARVRELRDAERSGSDDVTPDDVSNAQKHVDGLEAQIRDLGGVPEPPSTTGSVGTTPAPAPTTPAPATDPPAAPAPAPAPDTVEGAQQRVDQLRASQPPRSNPPSPAELEWREQLNRAEEALAIAQAEAALARCPQPPFTNPDLDRLRRLMREIERLRAEEAGVNERIEELEAQFREAQGMLEANRGQSGGPSAGTFGATLAGAGIQQRLVPLYQEQARIRAAITRLVEEISALARERLRAAIECGGGIGVISVPSTPAERRRVETAILERVLGRLGIPGLGGIGPNGDGLLRRRRSVAPMGQSGCLLGIVVAVAVLLGSIFLLTRGDDDDGDIALVPAAGTVVGEPVDETTTTTAAVVEDAPGPATRAVLVGTCPVVVHQPPAESPDSLSQIRYDVRFVGLDGALADGATLTLDVGGDAPGSIALSDGRANLVIGISSYGTYTPRSATLTDPTGTTVEVLGQVPVVNVTASEGPVGGCQPTNTISDDDVRTAVGRAAITELFDALGVAHATGDAGALFDRLDAATIDRYGADQCRAYLESTVGSLEDPVVQSAVAQAWDYPTDGATTAVPDAWTATIDVTLNGQRQTLDTHVRIDGGVATWFTDCGEPTSS